MAYSLYTGECLQLRSKRPRRRKMFVTRHERYSPKRANQAWSMDFVADQRADGRNLQALTVIDVFTREAFVHSGGTTHARRRCGGCLKSIGGKTRSSVALQVKPDKMPEPERETFTA